MFCSRCGKTLVPEDKQCPKCGQPLGESRFPGMGYTSVQTPIHPGDRVSFVNVEDDAGFEKVGAASYVRLDYLGPENDLTAPAPERTRRSDPDTDTNYRPAPDVVPEDVHESMRAYVQTSKASPDGMPAEEEPPVPVLSKLSQEILEKVDRDVNIENLDPEEIKAEPIRSKGRAGISADVEEYSNKLDELKARKAARLEARQNRRRGEPAQEDVFEAAESGAEPADEQNESVQPAEDAVVIPDESEDEYEEGLSVKRIVMIVGALAVIAALVIGGVLFIRKIAAKSSTASIEGVTGSLYEEGLEAVKAHADSDYVQAQINRNMGDVLKLNTELQDDAAKLDALMPAEAAVNDALFLSALQSIQTDIGTAVVLDSTDQASGTPNSEESAARWQKVSSSISTLESAKTAAELTSILNSVPLTVGATPTPAPIADMGTTLSKGDKSDAVLDMQNRLYELGFLLDKRDGSFGNKTQTAVKLFQDTAGLPVTGIADAATLEALYSDNAPMTEYASITPVPAASGNTPADDAAAEPETVIPAAEEPADTDYTEEDAALDFADEGLETEPEEDTNPLLEPEY